MLQLFNIPSTGATLRTKGSFFRYEKAGSADLEQRVTVRADGNSLGTYDPGDSIRLPFAAEVWEIKPVGPTQTAVVRIGEGEVQSARLLGVVSVVEDIGANVQTAAQEDLSVGTGLWVFSTPLLDPSQNTGGVIVRQATAQVASSGAGAGFNTQARIVASPTQPTGSSGAQYLLLATVADATATLRIAGDFNFNRRLPAGWGLWHGRLTINGVAPAGNSASVSFEKL